jgi:hypothetical protein
MGASAAASGSQVEAGGFFRRLRRRERCCAPAAAEPVAHCEWDRTTVTFLVHGKFTDGESNNVNFGLANWYKPDGRSYWPMHDRCWCSNYGVGTKVLQNQEEHFFWGDNINVQPNQYVLKAAAEKIAARCLEMKAEVSTVKNIRLVGHSAGAVVCSMATHLIDEDKFKIADLILLSPPVFLPDGTEPHPKFSKENYKLVFPKLARLPHESFVNIHPRTDRVLRWHGVQQHYRFQAIADYPDDTGNIQRIPGKQITTPGRSQTEFELPNTMAHNHWEPCNLAEWTAGVRDRLGYRV